MEGKGLFVVWLVLPMPLPQYGDGYNPVSRLSQFPATRAMRSCEATFVKVDPWEENRPSQWKKWKERMILVRRDLATRDPWAVSGPNPSWPMPTYWWDRCTRR